MASSSKRQQTAAKRSREQLVKQRREQKLAKKYAAAEARNTDPTAEPSDKLLGPRLIDPGPGSA
jgi:hypothetical protein